MNLYLIYQRMSDTTWLTKRHGFWRLKVFSTRQNAEVFARSVSNERMVWEVQPTKPDVLADDLIPHHKTALMRLINKVTRRGGQ